MAALLVVEKCSRTNNTLRPFSFSRLALKQNLNVLDQFWDCGIGNAECGIKGPKYPVNPV